MTDYEQLLSNVREEVRERLAEDGWTDEPHDIISEIADGSVPVYTYALMQLGADNLGLATSAPELGPAFDGSPTPVNIIAANVYEALEAACWETFHDMQTERENDAEALESSE